MLRFVIFLLAGAAAAVFAALAFTLSCHCGLNAKIAACSLGMGAAVGICAGLHARPARLFRLDRVSPWAWVTLAVFAWFALRAFCWLVFFHEDRIEITSPNNLGDLSLHMMLANYFAAGASWWPDHPEYAWGSLRYYPGIDLLQAMWQSIGAPEFTTLVWVGLLGSLATAVTLYAWGGGFGVAAFLFSGGLAGFQIFAHGRFADYQADLAWKSLPLAIFVTQRGFLFALPAGLLLLAHWRQRFFPMRQSSPDWPGASVGLMENGLLPFWVEALLYAATAVFQLFTFLFLSLLLGWWLVLHFQRGPLRRHIGWLLAVAFLPVSVVVVEMTEAFTVAGAIHLHPGWLQHDQNFFWFWLLNFGLFAPLAIALWIYQLWPSHEPNESAEAFVLPAGLIFMFACVVMLSPWEWDNTKILLWCYLAAAPYIWQRFVAPFAAPIRIPICLALFLSGAVCLIGSYGPRMRNLPLAIRSEVDAVRTAVDDIPIGARFAAAPAYDHPLVFAGRKLAMGYAGHLFSQGIDYKPLSADLFALMNGEDDWRKAARRLDVQYVFWGPREQKEYPGSTKAWARKLPPFATGAWGAIYDLSSPVSGDAAAPKPIGAEMHESGIPNAATNSRADGARSAHSASTR